MTEDEKPRPLPRAQLAEDYAGGMSIREIATARGTTYGRVYRALIRHGVTMRPNRGAHTKYQTPLPDQELARLRRTVNQ